MLLEQDVVAVANYDFATFQDSFPGDDPPDDPAFQALQEWS